MGLEHLFDTPSAKILDLLMSFSTFDYSIKDICEGTGVSFRTAQRALPSLVKRGLLIKTRKEGRAQMYIINSASPVVKKLDELSMADSLQHAEMIAAKEKHHKFRHQVPDVMKHFAPVLVRAR